MAADDDDVLPVDTEQRYDQQAIPVERLVHSALRSPPFFCLKQRHYQNASRIRRHYDADESKLQLTQRVYTPVVAMTSRGHNIVSFPKLRLIKDA